MSPVWRTYICACCADYKVIFKCNWFQLFLAERLGCCVLAHINFLIIKAKQDLSSCFYLFNYGINNFLTNFMRRLTSSQIHPTDQIRIKTPRLGKHLGSLNKSFVVCTCNLGTSGDWVPTCIRYHLALGIIYINHPQRLCSFWSAESESDFLSMHREFISYSQPILSYFSDLTLSIHNSWPFSVTPGQRS